MKKDSGIPKNVVNGKTDKEKIVNEEVANKRVEDENVEVEEQNSQVGKEEKRKEKQFTPGNVLIPNNPSPIVPPLSFPQRFIKIKLDGKFATFFNMFKELEVNILFAEALAQMFDYVKFMK